MSALKRYARPSVVRERFLESLIFLIGTSLTLFVIWYALTQGMQRVRFANLFLGVGLTLYYLLEIQSDVNPESDESVTASSSLWEALPVDRLSRIDVAKLDVVACLFWIAAALAVTAYIELNYDHLLRNAKVMGYTTTEHVLGAVIIAVVTDSTRRAYGNMIAGFTATTVLYALVGPWMPGILRHTGMSWQQIAEQGAMQLAGTYGFILQIGSTWVAIFLMFAGMAKAYGLMDFILSLGREISKSLRSGVVHVAVISSMAMGSITGSAAANTATTGSFTIPMMLDQEVGKDYATAIEAVASSGGQMMPPVMGVAAFLMADILGVAYVDVLAAGLIPAALFYFSVAVAVQLLVYKYDWTTAPGTFDRGVLKEGAHFSIPIGVLIYTLVVMRLTPLRAGLYTIVALVLTAYTYNLASDGLAVGTVVDTTVQTFKGFARGATELAPLIGVLGALGVIVAMITQTGLSQKLSTQMVGLAGGVMVILLILAMLTSILFGLGMPTPAAYILVVILVAPAMVDMGISELRAHFFVFYFAMLSAITPPVAIAVAVGTQISGSNFLKSCVQALRIGSPGFVVPFAFISNEHLIEWVFPYTLIESVIVFLSIIALLVAILGYDGRSTVGYVSRAGFFALAFVAMFAPMLVVQIAATAAFVAAVLAVRSDYSLGDAKLSPRRWL